jgi:U2-associated protein SR140
VVQVTASAFSVAATPMPIKLARLYLVSDILHNSSAAVTNAAAYRTAFQSSLPLIFTHLGAAYRRLEGRLSREKTKDAVFRVLGVWVAWSLFPEATVSQWKLTFLRGPSTGTAHALPDAMRARLAALPHANTQTQQQQQQTSGVEVVEGEDLDGEPLDDDDLDGVPMDE